MSAADSMTSGGPAHRAGGPAEVVRLRKLVAMCSHLSAAAAQQVELDAITRFLAAHTGSAAAVLDRGFAALAASGGDADAVVATARDRAGAAGLNSVLAAAARNRRALLVPGRAPGGRPELVVVAPVSVGDEVAGYLVVVGGHEEELGPDMMLLACEHAAMVCGVLLGRGLVVTAAAGRARRELVEGLLLARGEDDGEAARWARHLGYDEHRPHAVLTLALAAEGRAGAQATAENVLSRLATDAILASRTDEVVAVVPEAAPGAGAVERAHEVARRGIAQLGERGVVVAAAGVGNQYRPAADVARSYSEARRALAAGQRMGGPGRVVLFAELGIHRLLVRFPDPTELRAFGEEVIGQLVREDAAAGTGYVATLAVYFQENSSPSRAAKRLHVHPNTVAYRLRRIEDITGLRLDRQRDRLMAELAVEIVEGLRA
jgi:hypothetical protein